MVDTMQHNIYYPEVSDNINENKSSESTKDSVKKQNLVKQILHNETPILLNPPLPESQVTCPACHGNQGVYVKNEASWFCTNGECSIRNLNASKRTIAFNRIQQKTGACATIPLAYKDASLAKISGLFEMCDFLSLFAKQPNDFVILIGNTGTGKTYTACAALNSYLKNGKTDCEFIHMSELYVKWLDIKNEGKGEPAFIQKYSDIEFLVIDDLGMRDPTEAFLDILHLIFDKRKNESKGTIITTNLMSEAFTEKFGAAICSRIASGKKFKLEGKDKRYKQPISGE